MARGSSGVRFRRVDVERLTPRLFRIAPARLSRLNGYNELLQSDLLSVSHAIPAAAPWRQLILKSFAETCIAPQLFELKLI